jgi:hypothetical protein
VGVFFKTQSWRKLRRDRVFTVVERKTQKVGALSVERRHSKFALQAGKFRGEILG